MIRRAQGDGRVSGLQVFCVLHFDNCGPRTFLPSEEGDWGPCAHVINHLPGINLLPRDYWAAQGRPEPLLSLLQ